jgi:hypothetical protein
MKGERRMAHVPERDRKQVSTKEKPQKENA